MADKLYEKASRVVESMNRCAADGHVGLVALCLQDNSIRKLVDRFITISKHSVTNELLDLITSVIVHSKTVYESDRYMDPFDDEIYDKMLSRFKKYRAEPFGSNSTGLANAKYKYDRLSGTLDKVHFVLNKNRETNELRDSLEDYIRSLPVGNDDIISMVVNQKKDGTSVTIDYKLENGSYVANSAISRGKKDYGEGTNVDAILPMCKFETNKIKKVLGYIPEYIGIQYEMLISDDDMKAFGTYSKQTFANNRSAVSGLLRRMIFAKKKERMELKQFVSLVPVGFDILPEYIKDKNKYRNILWSDIYEAVCGTFIFGNIDMEYDIIHGTKNEILTQFISISEHQLKKRKKLNHAVDGLVLTILDEDLKEKLGRSNNINKWQIAYKFPEEGKKTKIIGVDITTGNFGYKEILLQVEPVVLNGTIQSKAQVHSLNKFKKMDLRIGDELILKLSGDVIPFGYKDSSCHAGSGKKIKLPTICDCGAPLEEEKNKLRCVNKRCPFRIVGSMVTFFTELNAKGIGQQTCKLLYDELGISRPSDILKLGSDDFKKLSGFKDKSAELAVNTLKDIIGRPRTVASILSSLGIDSFRTTTANKLLESIDINELISLIETGDKERLISVVRNADGINENAEKIAEGLIENLDEIKSLLGNMTIKTNVPKGFDKTVVVSGMRNDEELIDIANSAGFNVRDAGKLYDVLVIKDSSYYNKSKALYATENGIPVLTRDAFISKYKK